MIEAGTKIRILKNSNGSDRDYPNAGSEGEVLVRLASAPGVTGACLVVSFQVSEDDKDTRVFSYAESVEGTHFEVLHRVETGPASTKTQRLNTVEAKVANLEEECGLRDDEMRALMETGVRVGVLEDQNAACVNAHAIQKGVNLRLNTHACEIERMVQGLQLEVHTAADQVLINEVVRKRLDNIEDRVDQHRDVINENTAKLAGHVEKLAGVVKDHESTLAFDGRVLKNQGDKILDTKNRVVVLEDQVAELSKVVKRLMKVGVEAELQRNPDLAMSVLGYDEERMAFIVRGGMPTFGKNSADPLSRNWVRNPPESPKACAGLDGDICSRCSWSVLCDADDEKVG